MYSWITPYICLVIYSSLFKALRSVPFGWFEKIKLCWATRFYINHNNNFTNQLNTLVGFWHLVCGFVFTSLEFSNNDKNETDARFLISLHELNLKKKYSLASGKTFHEVSNWALWAPLVWIFVSLLKINKWTKNQPILKTL